MMMVVYFAWGLLAIRFPLPTAVVLAIILVAHHARTRGLPGWRL